MWTNVSILYCFTLLYVHSGIQIQSPDKLSLDFFCNYVTLAHNRYTTLASCNGVKANLSQFRSSKAF